MSRHALASGADAPLYAGTEDIPRPRFTRGPGAFPEDMPRPGRPVATMDTPIPASWTTICTLQLRGLYRKDIAEAMQMSEAALSYVFSNPRYLAYRDQRIDDLDEEFLRLKPLAIDALKRGLTSTDGNISLRASEQWFRGASFRGFGSGGTQAQPLTAEDVATRLLQKIEVNVNVNTADRPTEGVCSQDAPRSQDATESPASQDDA